MATVNLAAAKIGNIVLGWPMGKTLAFCAVITVFFASVSGLWGVLVTDSIQFGITMTGTFAVAYFAVKQPRDRRPRGPLAADRSEDAEPAARFLGLGTDASSVFLDPAHDPVVVGLVPGRRAGRRQLHRAAHARLAHGEGRRWRGRCFFNVAALRPAPLAVDHRGALLDPRVSRRSTDIRRTFPYVEPRLIGHDMAYPAMLRFLPAGFLGLMVAGMLAAYRSTIETHLNWGTSYLVHDFYRRFLRPDASGAALRLRRAAW